MSQRLRNFCFTINNYTEETLNAVLEYGHNNASYCVIGKETGEKGTPHLQGYIELTNQKHFSTIKKEKAWTTAHIEKRKGTANQAAEYCKKEKDFQEIGTISKMGERTDINKVYELAKEGTTFETFLDSTPNLQNIRIFEIAKSVYQKERRFKPEVYWLWGATGTGKTRYVVEKETDLWISGKNLRWWEGYDNQEATLFDDFRKDFCTFHELLRILDRYPYTVEVKGGSRKLNSKRMYITSCYPPEEMYNTREDVNQLIRRCTEIIELGPNSEVLTQRSGGNTIPPTSNQEIYECLLD